jgi:DNA (cytosine-5)-methyltransferase 1
MKAGSDAVLQCQVLSHMRRKAVATLNSIEICAGAGGQALGLEQAGFSHVALVEIDGAACRTLRMNRPEWNVIERDVKSFCASEYRGKVDLLAGGVPCPPFSVAGRQLGHEDERDLFPEAIRLIIQSGISPAARPPLTGRWATPSHRLSPRLSAKPSKLRFWPTMQEPWKQWHYDQGHRTRHMQQNIAL